MIKNILSTLLLFSIFSFAALAQDETLFTIGNTNVKKSEFEYIYKKNNINNKADFSKKSLQEYLDLYINFRLKVKEAEALGLDTLPKNKEELKIYENQLLDSYTDKEVLEKLIKQEYERSKTDVNISHIFFAAPNTGNEADAMTKALNAVGKLKSNVPFNEVAKTSEDKKSALHDGNLGWFNAYQIGLPEIEEAVYNMKTGEVSTPIKTRLGYHILKLNDTRPAKPKIKVAIIKRFFPIADTSVSAMKAVEDSMQLAYSLLKSNRPFENIVERFSEDEASAVNKGAIDWFGINTYATVFEETAYALKDGDFSAPFKTNTAWYIVKRLETEKTATFDESTAVLKIKLPSTPVYQYEMEKFIKKIADKYNAKEYQDGKIALKQHLIELATVAPFIYKDTTTPKPILQIGNKLYTENDYGKEIQLAFYTTLPKPGADKYDMLIKNATQKFIKDYYKQDIKNNNEEFKALMNEYKNGIMIFSLSEKYIWNKAAEDTIGLKQFYETHKDQFNLKNRATVRTISTNTKSQANTVYNLLKTNANITDNDLLDKLIAKGITNTQLQSQIMDESTTKLNVQQANVFPHKLENEKYTITQVMQPQKARSRTFDECRGYVIAAYQENIEKKWLNELKQKYPVSINSTVFDSLVKKP